MKRIAGEAAGAAPVPPSPSSVGPDEGDGHAACRARAEELEARLAAAEAAASELRAANEALAREHAALKKVHDVCLFFERRRDFGAELPPGVLLNIMDHAPSSKCGDVMPCDHAFMMLISVYNFIKGASAPINIAPLSLAAFLYVEVI